MLRPTVALVCACSALGPRVAQADVFDWRWGGGFDIAGKAMAGVDESDGGGRVFQGDFALAARGVGGPFVLGWAGSVDAALGFEVPAGFRYGLHLMPLGLGVKLGARAWLGVATGWGFDAAPPRLELAGAVPVDGFLELDLGRRVRVHLGARATWVHGAASREGGSAHAPFGDELDLRFGLSFGRRKHEHMAHWGDFDQIAVVYREERGERFVGLTLALSVAAGSAPRR